MGQIVDTVLDIFCQLDTLICEKADFCTRPSGNMTEGKVLPKMQTAQAFEGRKAAEFRSSKRDERKALVFRAGTSDCF